MTAVLIIGLLLIFGALSGYAIHAHQEILRRQGEERLQSQLRNLEAAEHRQQELLLVMESFLQHKGVPISLIQKRELKPSPGWYDKKKPLPLQPEEMQNSK